MILVLGLLWLHDRSHGPLLSTGGANLRLVAGEGGLTPDGFEIRQLGKRGVAFVQGTLGPLEADRYPVLEWRLAGVGPEQEIQLVWSNADEPKRPYSRTLPRPDSGEGRLDLGAEPGWHGRIVAIGLLVRGPMREPIRIQRLDLRPAPSTPASLLTALKREWSAAEGWTGRSINFNVGSPSGARFHPLPIVALWIGLACLLYAAMNPPWRGARSPLPYALLVLLGWGGLDVLWQDDLVERARQTHERYAGLDADERQRAGPDRLLYPFLAEVREHLPDAPARIFILSADPGGSKVGRARYHLLPHDVSMGSAQLPGAGQARPDDYLLMLAPMPGVRFDPGCRCLVDGAARLPVDPVLAKPRLGELFRVRGGA